MGLPSCKLSEFAKEKSIPLTTIYARAKRHPLPEPIFMKKRQNRLPIKMYSLVSLENWLSEWNKRNDH